MSLFFRFLRFARPYRWRIVLALFLVLITTASSMAGPWLMQHVIDSLAEMQPPPLLQGIVDTGDRVFGPQWGISPEEGGGGDYPDVRRAVLVVVYVLIGLAVVGGVVGYLRSLLLLFVGNRVVFDMRQRIFRHLQRLSMRFFERKSKGRIMSRVLRDVDAVQQILTRGVVNLLTKFATLLIAIGILISYAATIDSYLLTGIAIGALPLYVINFLMFQRQIRQAASEERDQHSEVYSVLSETLSGIRVIKAFAREQHEARRFVREVRDTIDLRIKTGKLRALLKINARMITRLANLIVLMLGAFMVIDGKMTLGQLVAFRAYMGRLYGPVIAIVTINDTLNWVLAAVERIFETLDTMPHIDRPEEPIRMDDVEGRVEFEHVDFAYDPGETVLHDINIDAQPGTVTALVGPSGSGKTTLVHLIPRFYDAIEGRILIDGKDLRDLHLITLRRNIGMVLQETFLFQGTLRENIKYGRPEATDEEVVQASIAANCHEFIMEFSDGYESVVGERGTKLSGGQKQRIAIARAILRDPKIMILDEATSDLDSESEALIHDALDKLMQNRTTFIIAHRLSTVMNADEIVVLDEGEIVERGKHAELATAGGVYEKLCDVQFKQAQEKIDRHLADQEDSEEQQQEGEEQEENGQQS